MVRTALVILVLCSCASIIVPDSPPQYTGNLEDDFALIRSEYKLQVYDCTDQSQVLRDYLLKFQYLEQPKELFFVFGTTREPIVWHKHGERLYPDNSHVWLEYWYIEHRTVRSGPIVLTSSIRHYIVYDPLRNLCGITRPGWYLIDTPDSGVFKRRMIRAKADLVLMEKTDHGYRNIGDRYWNGKWWRNTDEKVDNR